MLAGNGRRSQTKEHLFKGECKLTEAIVEPQEGKIAAMLKEEGIEKRHISKIQRVIKEAINKIRTEEHTLDNHKMAPTMIGIWDNITMLQIRKVLMEEAKLSEKKAWEKIDKMTIIHRDTAKEVNKQIAKHKAGLTEDVQEGEVKEAQEQWTQQKEVRKAEKVKEAWETEKREIKETKETSRTAQEQRKKIIWNIQRPIEKEENRIFTEEEKAAMEMVREKYGKVKRRSDKQLMRLIDDYPESKQTELYIEAMHTWKTWMQDGQGLIGACKDKIRKNYKDKQNEQVLQDIQKSPKINSHMKQAVLRWTETIQGEEWLQKTTKKRRRVNPTKRGMKHKRETGDESDTETVLRPSKGARAESQSQMDVQHPRERACTPSQTKLN